MSTLGPVKPTGPSADPSFLPSHDASNPYGMTEALMKAAGLPPKETDKYIFFFGYENTPSNQSPFVVFQQWFPAPFKALKDPYSPTRGAQSGHTEMVEFPTSEHYMMYHKAMLMGDRTIADKILAAPHPSQAKKMGREVRNFDQDLWIAEADRVVEEGNEKKFGQNPELKKVLLSTGDKVIVEASPDDKIWGIGFNSEDAEGKESEWGNNGLGKALMKVREKLNA